MYGGLLILDMPKKKENDIALVFQRKGQSIGDIQFLDKSGILRITFNGVARPHNVANLAKAEMRLNK